MPNFNVYF